MKVLAVCDIFIDITLVNLVFWVGEELNTLVYQSNKYCHNLLDFIP